MRSMPLLLPWSRAVNNKAKGVVPFASRPVQELNLDLREKLPVEKKSKKLKNTNICSMYNYTSQGTIYIHAGLLPTIVRRR